MADKIVIGVLRALLTADTAQFEGGMRQASQSLKAFSKDAAQFSRLATSLGTTMTLGITAPLTALGVGVAKLAIDFESSFAGVRKTTEASEAQFREMAAGLRELSKQIPINVNELNHLAEIAGALGIPTKDVVAFTEVMAKLGKTTNVTAEEAANAIAKIQNIFAASGKDTDRFASALVLLGNKGASTEAQILELANRTASMGRAIGLTQADVLGFAAAIANVGIEAEAGGSAISRTFNDIALAVANGTKDLQGFARVAGMSVDDFVTTFKTDARSALLAFFQGLAQVSTGSAEMVKQLNEIKAAGGDVNAALAQMVETDTDMAAVLKDLGIIEVRQLNLLRALALAFGTEQGLARSIEFANKGFRENTELNRASGERFKTTAAELVKFKNALFDIGITAGTALLPIIKSMTSLLTAMLPVLERAAELFAMLPMPVQAGIVAFGALVAAAGPVLFVLGQLAFAASQVALALGPAGIFTRGITSALVSLKSLGLGFTTVTAAIRASTLAMGLFSAALIGGIVIPAALIALQKMLEDFRKHQQDMIDDRNKLATAQNLLGQSIGDSNVAILNQADVADKAESKLTSATKSVQTLTKAEEVLRREMQRQDDVQRRGFDAMQGQGKIAFNELISAANTTTVTLDKATGKFVVASTGAKTLGAASRTAGAGIATLTTQLRQHMDVLAKLTDADREQIRAGFQLNMTNQEIADAFNKNSKAVKLTAEAIGIYRDQVQAASTVARRAARDFAELTGVQERQEAFDLAIALQTKMLDLSKMTIDSQREVYRTLRDGVESWLALGQAVPFSVQQQLDAVFKLRVIPDVLKEIREGTEGFKQDQREIFNAFVENQKRMADSRQEAQMKAINAAPAAAREAAEVANEIEFQRAQHTITMAEQAGAHWRDIYAMERALHRARVNAAIEEENRLFRENTVLLDRTDQFQKQQYDSMLMAHNNRVRQMEEQFILSEAAKWDALRRTKDVWFVALKSMKDTGEQFFVNVTDNLLSILTGLGHDADGELRRAADEAKEHFDKVKASGKSSAEAISNAFQRWREAEDRASHTFLERMRDVWLSFKDMVIDILNDILGHFVRSFIGGMVRAMTGAKLGGQLGNLLTGAGPGGIGSAIGQGAATVGGVVAGGGAGGALATTTIAGTGIPTVAGAGGTGLLAPGAGAGGGGAMGFLSNPAFWSNPYTIVGIGAAALLTWGITQKGWFRGGEEGVKVNPRRDQFQLQFGRSGESVAEAGQRLAALMTRITGQHGGGALFQAMQSADTVREFEAAQMAIVELLKRNNVRVRSFETGGFVPPGAVVPAVLHGGLYGEDIEPRGPDGGRREVHVHHNIAVEGLIDRENFTQFYREVIIPLEKQALALNTDDLLTTYMRVSRP